MILNKLTLSRFRNYREAKLDFSGGKNIILGNNAQGKTNLLESVFFLSCARSFRAKKEIQLILFGENTAKIDAEIETFERRLNVEIELSCFQKRRILVNGLPEKKLSDYVGLVKTILFSPDDLNMIKEGPRERRRFIDIALSQLKPKYLRLLSEHGKILAHKNKIIKSGDTRQESKQMLDVFNVKLSGVYSEIIAYRARFVEELNRNAALVFKDISMGKDGIEALYKTDSAVSEDLLDTQKNTLLIYEHLNKRIAIEREIGQCLIGAHRDDIEIKINGKCAKIFASQGQIRSAVLAMKFAERDIFKNHTGENPILLLDDVLSELDGVRRNYLLGNIGEGQVFITSCENVLSRISGGKVFCVENGIISEEG